jgi:hypothetical protein
LDKVLVRKRSCLAIAYALLGLLFLSCFPAIEAAQAEAFVLDPLDCALSLPDNAGGEADGEACAGAWPDGDGADDAGLSDRPRRASAPVRGSRVRWGAATAVLPCHFAGVERATGPPSL